MSNWYAQFVQPTGWRGWLVGQALSWKNRERSKWVLTLLDARPGERVLEIGYGPGSDVRRVSRLVGESGFVGGVDHSETMWRMAASRNSAAVRGGVVELHCGTAQSIPFADGRFDAAYAINVAQFWKRPEVEVAEIRRVLRPGGRIAIAVQPRNAGATAETSTAMGEFLARTLREAGFDKVRIERHEMRPVPVVCALGVNV